MIILFHFLSSSLLTRVPNIRNAQHHALHTRGIPVVGDYRTIPMAVGVVQQKYVYSVSSSFSPLPPHSHPPYPRMFFFSYQDPFPMDDTDPRVLKNYSLKSGNRSESLLSRKSKHKSESRQRLLAELSRIYPDLHLTSSPTPSPPSESKSSHSKRSDPSPTDSHAHRRPDSHQPSRKRSNDSSFSSILLITTERLHSETARANSAEKQIGDVMSLFRNTHEQKVKLERELLRVKEELSMYKVQLEVAQKGKNGFFYVSLETWSESYVLQKSFVPKTS